MCARSGLGSAVPPVGLGAGCMPSRWGHGWRSTGPQADGAPSAEGPPGSPTVAAVSRPRQQRVGLRGPGFHSSPACVLVLL